MRSRSLARFTSLALAVAIPISGMQVAGATPVASTASKTQDAQASQPDEAILEGLSYNTQTGLYVYDVEQAVAHGADRTEAEEFARNISNLSAEQTADLNAAIGFNPDEYQDEVSPQIPVFLIPILKAVGGAAANVILQAVGKWGLAEACKQLEGRFGPFDSLCKANGWQ